MQSHHTLKLPFLTGIPTQYLCQPLNMQYQTKLETNVSADIINHWGRSFYHLEGKDFSKTRNRTDPHVIRLRTATSMPEAR